MPALDIRGHKKLCRVQKFLKAKQSEGRPVEAYREQLEYVCRKIVEQHDATAQYTMHFPVGFVS